MHSLLKYQLNNFKLIVYLFKKVLHDRFIINFKCNRKTEIFLFSRKTVKSQHLI